MKKFNPKEYRGKNRIYCQLIHYPRVSKLWIWSESKNEYEAPDRGKAYCAKKYVQSLLGRKRVNKFFSSLAEALDWQSSQEPIGANNTMEAPSRELISKGPLFKDFLAYWKKLKYCQIRQSTQLQYEKLLRLYFRPFMDVPVESIGPQLIDSWIAYLKDPESGCSRNQTRNEFKHELRLLNTILKDYIEYNDNTTYVLPIKRRHRRDIIVRQKEEKSKDISESAFMKFREELRSSKNGKILAALATVQYYQGLRISEAAAIAWEDVRFNCEEPSSSRLVISKSVQWIRKRGYKATVVTGFKNSKSLGGIKEQPIFKQSYKAFKEIFHENASGLVFGVNNMPLEYRSIQNAYDRAFKKAGLPYSGTHIMRHGGTQRIFNKTPDLPLAGQLLGNKDPETIKVYAQRSVTALTEFSKEEWAAENS
ncbi:MAG: tyrosine-type recombinase/integrase [Pseudobdellovibrionaceae bacterium]